MLLKPGRMVRSLICKNVVVNVIVVDDITTEVICDVAILVDDALYAGFNPLRGYGTQVL